MGFGGIGEVGGWGLYIYQERKKNRREKKKRIIRGGQGFYSVEW